MPKAPSFPKLYPIVDVDVAGRVGWTPTDLVRAYLLGGAKLLQLRAKTLSGAAFLEAARAVTRAAHDAGARVIINDRADIAVLAEADGVHVGQEDLTPRHVRRITGDTMMVGYSTHTVDQVQAALDQPVSYIAVGPIFGTSTKETGYSAVGLDLIARAVELAGPRNLPVVAIGGITRERVAEVWKAGAASVAVITDLLGDDPAARIADFLERAERL